VKYDFYIARIFNLARRISGLLVLFVAVFSLFACVENRQVDDGNETMSVNISVQVAIDEARALHQLGPATPESEKLLQLQRELGIHLRPTFPDAEDPNLIVWFTAQTSSLDIAEQAINRLQAAPAVEAAFIKPPDELP
jgi:hypothetical protein